MADTTHYSDEIADKILSRMSEGESLRAICSAAEMPNRGSVLRWVRDDHEGFQKRYSAAIDLRAQCMEEDMLEKANGALALATGAPGTGEASARVQAVKLEVDTLKWTLARMAPKRYGDKITQEITGPDGGPLKTEDVGSRDITHEEFEKLREWVKELRGTTDEESRKSLYQKFPEKTRDALEFADMHLDADEAIMAQARDKGLKAL